MSYYTIDDVLNALRDEYTNTKDNKNKWEPEDKEESEVHATPSTNDSILMFQKDSGVTIAIKMIGADPSKITANITNNNLVIRAGVNEELIKLSKSSDNNELFDNPSLFGKYYSDGEYSGAIDLNVLNKLDMYVGRDFDYRNITSKYINGVLLINIPVKNIKPINIKIDV